ncbi:MAG: hypothetical protein ACREV9_03340 [Burkholderiales bacterium]
MSENTAFLILASLLIAFLAAIVFLISRASGWSTLAQKYPLRAAFPKPKIWLGYAVFRGWIGYNGGIIVGSDSRGLCLRAMPIILSFCHVPIFIPWSEIRVIEQCTRFLRKAYRIRVARAPDVDFALRPGTFELIREDAKRAGVPGDY